MFKNLKEKLKGWVKKAEDEPEEEKVKETVIKDERVGAKEKKKKNPPKEKPSQKKEKVKTKISTKKTEEKRSEPVAQEVLEKKDNIVKEVPEGLEKRSFIQRLISKKEDAENEDMSKSSAEKKEETSDKKVGGNKKSFFNRALSEEKFDEIFDELELILMQNNIAIEATQSLKESLKDKLVGESAKVNIEDALRGAIEELLQNPPNFIENIKEKLKEKTPYVILFAGINGAGKTTTIAKVANLLKKNKISVCLASADTFRAAAIEQLQVHADRLEVPLVKKDYGADPAAVGFDAVKYAKKNNIDVVLIDSAGRMNNRDTLMKEIEKIQRVNSPDLTIFLGESITGNDATQQAKDFNNAINIDGIILSKADVDEKGGTAISISHVTKKPIYFLGMGQGYDDLEVFDKEKLLDKIFGD